VKLDPSDPATSAQCPWGAEDRANACAVLSALLQRDGPTCGEFGTARLDRSSSVALASTLRCSRTRAPCWSRDRP